MEVECIKYRERMSSEQAECRHPDDYCKFRSSCIIHFLGCEKKKEGAGPSATEAGAPGVEEESEKQ